MSIRPGALLSLLATLPAAQDEADHYTIDWLPTPEGERLEVGGLDSLEDGRLVVTTRRGQIWLVDGHLADDPAGAAFTLFAEGLQEGLGARADGDALWVVQRGELSRLRDEDGDGRADAIDTVASDWGLSGNYHEFAFGLPRDAEGRFYLSLNVAFEEPQWWHGQSSVPWRGWVLRADEHGALTPFANGFRSPCGIALSPAAELFVTDNQGDWVPTSPIYHVREGGFYGHPASLAWDAGGASGLDPSDTLPPARGREPAAVWIPYAWSRSTGDLAWDTTGGRFGPFEGQAFVAELTNGAVLRAWFEAVTTADGEELVQGAVVPFRQNVGSACRVHFAPDGTLIAGLTNRGWGGLPPDDGLARIRYTGTPPMEVLDAALLADGFRIRLTEPAPADAVPDVRVEQYDYDWWWEYGSPERHHVERAVEAVELTDDRRTLTVRVAELAAGMVARVRVAGLGLLHEEFAYTINALPGGERVPVAKVVPPPPPREARDEGWLRLTWADAFDTWRDATGWELCDVRLDPTDRTRFLIEPGNGALANAGEGAAHLESRYDFGDHDLRIDFQLPEDGETELFLLGRYGITLSAGDCGALTGVQAPDRQAFQGAGLWHQLDVRFRAPRWDEAGEKYQDARIERLLIDDVLLHERVELEGPTAGAPYQDEARTGPVVVRGDGGVAGFRGFQVKSRDARDDPGGDRAWTRIFDGESIGDWHARGGATWRVVDGVLIAEGAAGHLFSPRGDYADHELRAAVRINDGGNSGMYVRAELGDGWPAGYEAQVNCSHGDPQKTGSLYGLAPVKAEMIPPDVWFEQRVTVRDTDAGTHVVVRLNGVIVADFVDAERRHARGHVALQQHHEGSVVMFRDVEVREL